MLCKGRNGRTCRRQVCITSVLGRRGGRVASRSSTSNKHTRTDNAGGAPLGRALAGLDSRKCIRNEVTYRPRLPSLKTRLAVGAVPYIGERRKRSYSKRHVFELFLAGEHGAQVISTRRNRPVTTSGQKVIAVDNSATQPCK